MLLDADMLALRDADALFDAPDGAHCDGPRSPLNAGLVVVAPDDEAEASRLPTFALLAASRSSLRSLRRSALAISRAVSAAYRRRAAYSMSTRELHSSVETRRTFVAGEPSS